jgi:hypothetical protein
MTEEEERVETPARFIVGNIRGLKIRRHVNPSLSAARDLYRIERSVHRSIRGLRVLFTLFHNRQALYSTKIKGRRSSGPLPIARGSEMHYRESEFAAYLLSGNGHNTFSLRARTPFGNEILSIDLCHPKGRRSVPKHIEISFFLKDSLVPQKLVNVDPVWNPDGHWELNFGDRSLIPSIRNHIFVRQETGVEFVAVRKTEKHAIEVDAVQIISPLAVFGIVLALFQSPT